MIDQLPIVCQLGTAGQRQREAAIRRRLGQRVEAIAERENGIDARFPGDRDCLLQIAELMAFERACCRFLRFELIAEAGEGPLRLRIRGPEGTGEFLRNWFAPIDGTREPEGPGHEG